MTLPVIGPLEAHCVDRLERYRAQFESLYSSHKHSFRFEPTLARPSKTTFDGGHAVHELSVILLNQDPVTFLNLGLPHEFAHMTVATMGAVDGGDYKDHGEEWRGVLMSIDEEAAMVPKVESEYFDTRSTRILAGAVPFACKCDHDEGLQVVANLAKSIKPFVDGEVFCDICTEPMYAIDRKSILGKVANELQFLIDRNRRE